MTALRVATAFRGGGNRVPGLALTPGNLAPDIRPPHRTRLTAPAGRSRGAPAPVGLPFQGSSQCREKWSMSPAIRPPWVGFTGC